MSAKGRANSIIYSPNGVAAILFAALLSCLNGDVFGQSHSTPKAGTKSSRAWSWSEEVASPETNNIRPKSTVQHARQLIVRQLLAEARRVAEQGKLEEAEQIARRAETILQEALAQKTATWDPAEQTPAAFVIQLAAMRKQLPSPAATPAVKPQAAPSAAAAASSDDSWISTENTASSGGSPNAADHVSQTAVSDAVNRSRSQVHSQSAETATAPAPPEEPSDRAVTGTATPVRERVVEIRDREPRESRSIFADAAVQFTSTAVGLLVGIALLVALRTFIKRRYGADFGFVFRVEHVDGLAAQYGFTSLPFAQNAPLEMPTAGPGRNGAGAVLTEIPAGFTPDISPYEEEMQAKAEAEKEMMKMLLDQNLDLRQQLKVVTDSEADNLDTDADNTTLKIVA